jgi:molybdenum cofactor cytidylyltransferase
VLWTNKQNAVLIDRRGAPIAGVILAAGASTRLGDPKQLLKFEGVSLLRRTAVAAEDAGLNPLIVVLGSRSSEFMDEVRDLPVNVVVNDCWESGIGSSIRAGVAAVHEMKFSAIAILVIDQPFLTAAVIRGLTSAYRASDALVVASRYGDALGVPAVFDHSLHQRLLEIPVDRGAKGLIAEAGDDVLAVDFPEGAIDVDTPQDLAGLDGLQRHGLGFAHR